MDWGLEMNLDKIGTVIGVTDNTLKGTKININFLNMYKRLNIMISKKGINIRLKEIHYKIEQGRRMI